MLSTYLSSNHGTPFRYRAPGSQISPHESGKHSKQVTDDSMVPYRVIILLQKVMTDPELHEDKSLVPYRRELFPQKDELPRKELQSYKTREEVHGYSRSPFDSMSKSDWLKEPTGRIKINYK